MRIPEIIRNIIAQGALEMDILTKISKTKGNYSIGIKLRKN